MHDQRLDDATKMTEDEKSNLMRFSLYRQNQVLKELPKVMGVLDEGAHKAASAAHGAGLRDGEGEEKQDAGAFFEDPQLADMEAEVRLAVM